MGSASVPTARPVHVLRCKPGVTFACIAPGGFRILAALDNAAKVMSVDLIITAATNDHTTGRHVSGEAIDISTRDLTPQMVQRLKRVLEQALGDRFTVVFETPTLPTDPILQSIAWVNGDATGAHLHIQVKKATTYPPTIPASTTI